MIYKGKVMSSFILFARSVTTKQSPRQGKEIASSAIADSQRRYVACFLLSAPAPRPEKRAREPARAAAATFRFIIIFLKENRHGVALRRSWVSPSLFCEIK